MLKPLSVGDALIVPARHTPRWRRHFHRVSGWLLLAGWIVLPLLPVLGLGLSRMIGMNF